MWFISLKCLFFKMLNRILVSTKGSNNTWNLLSHFIISFQKKLFNDVFIFRTWSNKNMCLWEQTNMAGYQNQKLTEKSSWMKCYPNSKKHELLKMLVNLQWRIQGMGEGGWGANACPLFVVFFFTIAKFTSKNQYWTSKKLVSKYWQWPF